MNTEEFERQVSEAVARTEKMVKHWCPNGFDDEPLEHRLWRAFMHVAACAADQHRVLTGREAVKTLNLYPDPLVGFEK